MKYTERKTMMDAVDPDKLCGGKTPQALAEGYFRWHVLQLLADIADQQGSLAYAYQEMLKMQQKKNGQTPPRPGSVGA